MKRIVLLFLSLVFLCACNSHSEITTDPLPSITLEQSDYYTIKQGSSITISPRVEYGLSYAWLLDGVTVSRSVSYTFAATSVGTYYLTFRAENQTGSREIDIRIDVVALQPPVISFATGKDRVLTLPLGEHTLSAEVLYGEGASYEWFLDAELLSNQEQCAVTLNYAADHALVLRVKNEDGEAEEHLTLRAVNRLAGEIFISEEYATPLGRTLKLDATLCNFSSPSFLWQAQGVTSTDAIFAFTPSAEGEHQVSLTVTDADGYSLSRNISVYCTPEEGTYYREATSTSRATSNKVYAYRPAAGQFINEKQSGFAGENSSQAAIAYAEQRLDQGKYLSLGAWGGYVVVGFDHSVVNSGEDYDFSIAGNMHEGSSEAGIVWVMQDANGNGLPDDVWYELRGSEWATENYSRGYAITYYRPWAAGMGVLWRDNRGGSGVLRRNSTHTQEYYYPAWEQDSFTLYGSRLAPNTEVDAATGNYVNQAYEWGYADNQGADSDAGATGEAVKNYFKISSAVNADGVAVNLQYIDFVKVQSAINYTAGALGEISTEVLSFEDENM